MEENLNQDTNVEQELNEQQGILAERLLKVAQIESKVLQDLQPRFRLLKDRFRLDLYSVDLIIDVPDEEASGRYVRRTLIKEKLLFTPTSKTLIAYLEETLMYQQVLYNETSGLVEDLESANILLETKANINLALDVLKKNKFNEAYILDRLSDRSCDRLEMDQPNGGVLRIDISLETVISGQALKNIYNDDNPKTTGPKVSLFLDKKGN